MNLWMQLGIGVLPGILIALFFLIKRKSFTLRGFGLVLALLAICAGSLFLGIRQNAAAGSAGTSSLSKKEMMSFMNALVSQGGYTPAKETMDQYASQYGYDDSCRLLTARIALLSGKYDDAQGLYAWLSAETKLVSPEELNAANTLCQASPAFSLSSQTVSQPTVSFCSSGDGSSPTLLSEDARLEKARNTVLAAMEQEYPADKATRNCASAVCQIYADPNAEADDIRYLRRDFSSVEKDAPELLSLSCVQKARVQLYVTTEDYREITGNLNADSSHHELMIAAELYMSDQVRAKDFPEDFRSVSNQDIANLKAQIKLIYRTCSKDLSKAEQIQLKERVDALINTTGNAVLVTIREQLTSLNNGQTGPDHSKVCLELSKIENYTGNTTASQQQMLTAIETAYKSGDDNYIYGMEQLEYIIKNPDADPEAFYSIRENVEMILSHSQTVPVEDKVCVEYAPSSESNENKTSFSTAIVDNASLIRSAISIGSVDVSKFPTVTATLQISSDRYRTAAEIRDALQVYDCNILIKDFTLKKMEYSDFNIILLCDVSGSMSDNVGNLRSAVTTFLNGRNGNENICLVSFSNGIKNVVPFGSSNEDYQGFVDSLNANGGTDMFNSLVHCLSMFPSGGGRTKNIVILMTDGYDNYSADATTIQNALSQYCSDDSTTVYTIGLGYDVDSNYLQTLAKYGNGKMLPVLDGSSLARFYQTLHAQVDSQYTLTFKAEDTLMQYQRPLEISLPEDKTSDLTFYSISDISGTEHGDGETGTAAEQKRENPVFNGFAPREVDKRETGNTVELVGNGFDRSDSVTVTLKGVNRSQTYKVPVMYKDEIAWRVSLPSYIVADTYDAEISWNNERMTLRSALTVNLPGEKKDIAFGPYVFSANRITEGENSYNLSGNVTMNGWLHFSGTVTLTGDLANDYSITVTDNNGCYISFDPNLSSGLAKYYAKNSITVDFYRLGEFKLINDPRYRYNLDEYPVDNLFYPRSLLLFHTAGLLQPTLQVRPDKLAIDCTLGTTNLPFQDEILKSAKKMNIFSFNLSTNVSFSRTSVDLLIDCEVKQPEEEKDITSIFFLNNPLPSFSQAKIKLDTSSGEIVLGFTVNLGLFSEDSRFSLELGWKDWSLDSIELGHKLGEAIKVNCVVPLELNDFKVSVGNLATATSRDNFLKGLFSVELTGKMTISSMKVSEYFPAAKAFVKDLCLAEAPDTEISFRAYPLKIHGKADIKLFGEIDLLSAEITAGKYEYTNHILNVNAVETWGLSASVSLGITWEPESKFLYLKLLGTNKLDANGQFIGLSGTGTFECGARIWFVDISSDPMDGTAFVGFYRSPQQNKMRFIFGTQVTAGGKNKTNLYFINEAGNLTHTQGELN